jgi:hypothetical protein
LFSTGGFHLERLFTVIGNTEFGVLECVGFALSVAYAVCGLLTYASTGLSKELKSAVAAFMAALSIVFFELTTVSALKPQSERFTAVTVGAEIVLLLVFAISAGIVALTVFLPRRATPGTGRAGSVGVGPARSGLLAQRPGRAYYILPDMSDEEIERRLTCRNSE